MKITEANEGSREAIVALLQSQNLPIADLPSSLAGFYTALDSSMIVGVIGLERHGDYGLLRSMVVHPSYRDQKIAEQLVSAVEAYAAAANIRAIYLLTETAEGYFSRKGYNNASRDKVPDEVRKSSEFTHVCPASANVMAKQMAHGVVA